jgi:predicted N-formylglutamate amidohydrolase
LQSHRGWDPGALLLADAVASSLKCKFYFEMVSRLVVEQNRSCKSKQLFSSVTNVLPEQQKEHLLNTVYYPYHHAVETEIGSMLRIHKKIFHFSIHSFTPVFKAVKRKADMGLLYDPGRKGEKCVCDSLKKTLQSKFPGLEVRKNYPYKGTADGFTRIFRTNYDESKYCGIEVEINQKHFFEKDACWFFLVESLGNLIGEAVTGFDVRKGPEGFGFAHS